MSSRPRAGTQPPLLLMHPPAAAISPTTNIRGYAFPFREDDIRALFRINLGVGIPQNILLHLAHGVARQFIDHEHPLRHLEFGEPPVERLQHGGFANAGALVADHDGGDALADIGVRHADHGGFDHARHGVDLALDFLGIDIEAAGNHEILAAAENVHITLVVDLAEIAGDEEAVVAEFRFCLLRHPPIALEDVRTVDLDHADGLARQLLAGLGIGDAHGDTGQRVADRPREALAII